MIRHVAASLVFALSVSCSLQEQSAPPLIGPSEFSTSVTLTASPDVLATDGESKALVTITVLNAYGIAVRGLSLRAETRVNGNAVSLGTLSARNLATDDSGRATLAYVAPMIHGDQDTGIVVDIAVTPLGGNVANAVSRTVSIRLVPPISVR